MKFKVGDCVRVAATEATKKSNYSWSPSMHQVGAVFVVTHAEGDYVEDERGFFYRVEDLQFAQAPPALSAANAGLSRRMTKEDYISFHEECCTRMHDITIAKNADYTGNGDDPFANFRRVEALGICSTEQGFLTRMTDKLCRLSSYAQRGELSVKDESVEDTLIDLANYCILMAGYLRSKK